MPTAPARPCPYPGCPARLAGGERYCAEHRRAVDGARGNSTQRGYDREWRKLSKWFRQHHPLCVRCGALGELVDHIVPVRVDPSRRLEVANLQVLCRRCHKLKTDEDARVDWSQRAVAPREPAL